MNILEQKCASLAEVKDILEEKERDYSKKEMNLVYEQQKSLDYARVFCKISASDAEDIKKQINDLEMGIKENYIVKICDLLPETVDDLRGIFAKERFDHTAEDMKKILDIVDQYR